MLAVQQSRKVGQQPLRFCDAKQKRAVGLAFLNVRAASGILARPLMAALQLKVLKHFEDVIGTNLRTKDENFRPEQESVVFGVELVRKTERHRQMLAVSGHDKFAFDALGGVKNRNTT